jgi:hypothetical protein
LMSWPVPPTMSAVEVASDVGNAARKGSRLQRDA